MVVLLGLACWFGPGMDVYVVGGLRVVDDAGEVEAAVGFEWGDSKPRLTMHSHLHLTARKVMNVER